MGQLTALSMLLAWLVTALFSSLLLWRVRLLVRGPVVLGRAEAASHAVLLATINGGSVLLYLATMPWVYHEDFAWGAALGIGTLFAVLGVFGATISWAGGRSRRARAGSHAVSNHDRLGLVIAILLAALLFGLGRGGTVNRRWWLPLVAAGMIPFVMGAQSAGSSSAFPSALT